MSSRALTQILTRCEALILQVPHVASLPLLTPLSVNDLGTYPFIKQLRLQHLLNSSIILASSLVPFSLIYSFQLTDFAPCQQVKIYSTADLGCDLELGLASLDNHLGSLSYLSSMLLPIHTNLLTVVNLVCVGFSIV